MCSYFEIRGEGAVDEKQASADGTSVPTLNIGNMDPADARAVAGVLFELDLPRPHQHLAPPMSLPRTWTSTSSPR